MGTTISCWLIAGTALLIAFHAAMQRSRCAAASFADRRRRAAR